MPLIAVCVWLTSWYGLLCGPVNKIQFFFKFIHCSVHRDSVLIISNEMQQYAGIYLLQVYSTCFGRPSPPSSGVQKTVNAASGTGHNV